MTAEEPATWLACSTLNVRQLATNGVIERAGRGRYALKDSIQRRVLVRGC